MAIFLTVAISSFIIILLGWTVFISVVPLLFLLFTVLALVAFVAIVFFVGFGVYAAKNILNPDPISYYDIDDYIEELTDNISEIIRKHKNKDAE